VHLDRFQVGEHHRAVFGARLLLAKEELSRARLERILAAVEHVAHDDLRELVDEKRRHCDTAFRKNPQVARFEGLRALEPPEKIEQDAVVVSRIGGLDAVQRRRVYVPARIVEERVVQRALLRPGFIDGPDLGAQQIGAQEIVGDREPPIGVAIEQVKARIAPEILRNGLFLLKL
jgi:hypothetical protein